MENIEFLNWIAKGFNPCTGEKFSDNDLLLDSKVLSRLNELVRELKEDISFIEKTKKVKIEFTLEMCENLLPLENDTTISKIAKKIDGIYPIGYMTIIKRIQKRLIENGFLEERLADTDDLKSNCKFATEKGKKLGLSNVAGVSTDGRKYNSVHYSIKAQEYVKTLLPEVLNCELK